MIEYTSSTFWDFAYQTIDECKKYLEQLTSLNTAEGWEASWNLTVDLGVIQSQLFGYYGKLIPNDTQESQVNPNKHFYLPIPQTALDTYPGMKQNSGY